MIKTKKGFTLIEIIVCLILISIIGGTSIYGVNIISNNIKVNKLEDIQDKIFEAVNVYIENNKEANRQLYNNKNGVVVPLKVLENEGLIDFQDIKINEKKDYVVTMLSGSDCIDTTMIGSWIDGSKTIYLCAPQSSGPNDVKSKLTYGDGYYIARGENPNNWVEFPVTSDESLIAYFPNDAEKDLWRIVSIGNDGKIKLLYNRHVITNNSRLYDTNDSKSCSSSGTFYKLIDRDLYAIFNSDTGWDLSDIINEEYLKKQNLINNITNKDWIETEEYLYGYNFSDGSLLYPKVDYYIELKLGMLSLVEYDDSFIFNKTWITTPFIIGRGYGSYGKSSDAYITNTDIESLNSYTGCYYYNASGYKTYTYSFHGTEYHPVVTLNSKVQIKEDSSCSNTHTPGSKECPYKLVCDDC